MYTFINGRQIRDKLLLRAITSAYGPQLERGRYPVAVLYLAIPTDWVDVNVHPTKHEVRFVQSGRVFECVSRALKLTLETANWGEESTNTVAQSQWNFGSHEPSGHPHLTSRPGPNSSVGNLSGNRTFPTPDIFRPNAPIPCQMAP